MNDLPEPFVPAHIDRRNKPVVLVDFGRLLGSMLWAKASPVTLRAALALWAQAIREMPPASLPDDPEALAHWADVPLKRWPEIAENALRGFVPCQDGRLHHRVLADMIIATHELEQAALASVAPSRGDEAIGRRRAQDRERSARYRRVRNGGDEDNHATDHATDHATRHVTSHVTSRDDHVTVPTASRDDLSPLFPPLASPTPPSEHPPIIPHSTKKEGAGASSDKSAGSRLPADWTLSETDWDWSLNTMGAAPDFIRDVAARFADYWHARPGKDGRKSDWSATWRNWLRRAIDERGPRSASGVPRPPTRPTKPSILEIAGELFEESRQADQATEAYR